GADRKPSRTNSTSNAEKSTKSIGKHYPRTGLLQRIGLQTLVVDREGPAAGCSFGNGGAIGQNICAPFTQPGLLRQIPAWYLDPDGPVVVNPKWMLRSLPWILRWLAASRKASTYAASKAMAFLHYGCLDIYRESLGPALYAGLIQDTGYLYVYESASKSASEAFAEDLRAYLGIPGTYLSQGEVQELEPSLSADFKRGLILPGNSYTRNPARLVETIFTLFQQAGGTFQRANVRKLRVEGDAVAAVETDIGRLSAKQVVLCAGAWSGELLRDLGMRLPLVAERGYHISYEGSPVQLNYKVMNASRGFGATQMDGGLQVSGTVELTDVHSKPNWRRAGSLARNAARMFKAKLGADFKPWAGSRPSFPDSLPVVDRAARVANLYLNFGHSHWGLSGAPQSARLIGDLIQKKQMAEATAAFSAGRFKIGAPNPRLDDRRCFRDS
ncbi:NAD(P)/FAD-dependent oxidoreductase, partial [Aquamicrobium defluvii]